MARWHDRRLSRWLALILLLGKAGAAAGEPAFSRLYQQQYGYLPSCNACHRDGGGTPVNTYGQQFKEAGMNLAAFTRIAGMDADGDGFANEAEALAKANPGSARSTPENKGDWLDTASLIPKEVQAAFPEVRAYLPRDATLSEAEVTRAAAMGARLRREDGNTLYIPLVDRRPAGTAIIFPVRWQERDFFLLLATDRQLVVSRVSALASSQLPAEARQHPVYARLVGTPLDALPVPEGQDLESAILGAVKNAGTLVYLRLKGA